MKLSQLTTDGGGLLPPTVPEGSFRTVPQIITVIFNTIIVAAGAIFVVLLLIGGIQYLTGSGNEEATGKAKRLMIDAIIGLIIVLAAWAIGQWVLGRLGQ